MEHHHAPKVKCERDPIFLVWVSSSVKLQKVMTGTRTLSFTLLIDKKNISFLVCRAVAHGYNFDAISCESCKAFFRRNALFSMVNKYS